MLTELAIENFQSLRNVKLRLGSFTVVTGATGSGKTAVLRAVNLLAFNARGSSFVTQGSPSCRVGARSESEHWTVGIERHAKTSAKDSYRLLHAKNGATGGSLESFAKLGGAVPEKVATTLALSELNFAAQFDRPFLLDASGGEVARTLGALTGVSLLFAAAREANRRRLEAWGDLKRAQGTLTELRQQAQQFVGLGQRRQQVSVAEQRLEEAQRTEASLVALSALTDRLRAAQRDIDSVTLPTVPDREALDKLAADRLSLRSVIGKWRQGVADRDLAEQDAKRAAEAEQAAHARLHEVLVAAGTCPTCGSPIV